MKKICIFLLLAVALSRSANAQIDLNNLNLNSILGKVMNVKKGFAPKFFLGKQPIDKIFKVGEVLGLKKNEQVNKLFNTFRTGRTIYKAAAYLGGAIALYGTVRAIDKAAAKKDYQGALTGGLSTIASGLIVKFLTKGASYKAVDIFNGIVKQKVKDKIKDIISIAPASQTMGVGLYVKI